MIARALTGAMLLVTVPAVASTPAAWSAQERAARARCARASGLAGAVAAAPVIFGDAAGVDVLRVTGRLGRGPARGARVRMLCLYARRTGAVEVREAPAGW